MKDIPNYEGLYKISENGQVLGVKRKKFLIQQKHKHGYLQVGLCKNGIVVMSLIHRLVAKTYLKNPLNLPQVNHKDGNKLNNHFSNLEWCDNSYNSQHAHNNGLRSHKVLSGENARNAKLSQTEVNEIRDFYTNKLFNQKQLAYKYKVTQATISNVINNKHFH